MPRPSLRARIEAYAREEYGIEPGYPSPRWNWLSVALDGSVPLREIKPCLDESFCATAFKPANMNIPLEKRKL